MLHVYRLAHRKMTTVISERGISFDHEMLPKAQQATNYGNTQRPPLVVVVFGRL
jgi:hypothetical protein